MKRIIMAAACILAGAASAAAQGQTSSPLHNPKVKIEYVEPRYEQIYLRLKRRQILEELEQFLSPLRLKHELTLAVEEGGAFCNDPKDQYYWNSFYSPDKYRLTLCYSLFDVLENQVSIEFKRAPGEPFSQLTPGLMPGFTRAEVIVGGTVGLTLHELGHAIFHIQQIPRLGREEDAADMISAFIMQQFGKSVALTAIKGTYNLWHHEMARSRELKGTRADYEIDVHSLAAQRAINYLCIAYGGDAITFAELANRLLPPLRRPNCAKEYHQAELAFRKTVLPDIDQETMQKVRAMRILRPEDFKF